MIDKECEQRVLDSNRGDHAVLVLGSKKQQITTKYRSVEARTGTPVPTSSTTTKRRNPARDRRSKLLLEQFNAKKDS